MYILDIARTLKKMSINEIGEFVFENYYKRIEFPKENSFLSINNQKKNLQLFAIKFTEKIMLMNTIIHL